MRLLLEHCDYFKWEVTRKTKAKAIEDLDESNKSGDVRDVLVVFVASEEDDTLGQSAVLEQARDAIDDVAHKVKAKNIVLFPFVHLFPEGHPEAAFALDSTSKLYEALSEGDYNVKRVPFGWYKTHELKTKGHPLSVLSKTLRPELKTLRPELDHNDYI